MNITELVTELLKEGLYCNGLSYNKQYDSLMYEFPGFAKSGSGTLYENKEGEIHLLTRYNQDDIIESVEDFVRVAYGWDSIYCTESDCYCINNNYKKLYEKYNFNISNLK